MSNARNLADLSISVTSDGSVTANALSYTGALTGSTGILNIGSGQIYKDTSGNVGIGTSSPATLTHLYGAAAQLRVESSNSTGATLALKDTGTTNLVVIGSAGQNMYFQTGGSERMRIDSSGSVLIGSTSSQSGKFYVGTGDVNGWYSQFGSTSIGVLLGIRNSTASIGTVSASNLSLNPDGGNVGIGVTPKNAYSALRSLEIGPSSSALFGGFASSTNLQTWVANNTYHDGTADRYAVTGSPASMFRCVNGLFDWRSTGSTTGTSGGTATLNTFMSLDASGKLALDAITFYVGGGTSPAIYRSGVNGSGIHFTTNGGIPTNETGTISDNTESWGTAAWRWSVIYAVTGTINTSDRNEKQDISDLTAAELAVAVELKKLFKTFRWKDSVSKKGDDARIHIGVIAQDVWDAFNKQGLDASRYALWCEDVWYEVDGHGVDENSVPYTSEAEGAVRITRYGVRYDQLLAFVLAAM